MAFALIRALSEKLKANVVIAIKIINRFMFNDLKVKY